MSNGTMGIGRLAKRVVEVLAGPGTCCANGSEVFAVGPREAASATACCGASAAPAPRPRPAAGEATEFGVRSATGRDLEAVEALLAAGALPLDGLADQFGSRYAVAVATDGRVVGVAGLEVYGGSGLLRSVAVDPALRGRGVGEALTRDRIAAAEALGLASVYALTTTAANYFPRFGFEPVERDEVPAEVRGSVEFRGVCPASAAVLRLRLERGSTGAG